jgi:DNA topoisomerase-1
VAENVTRSDVAMAREIGTDPHSGRPVSVRYGKYGAFAQIGTREDAEKPRFASLRPGQRMDEITLDDALELFKLPRTLGHMPDGHTIKVAVGRFGPYVQYGTKQYVSLKKDDDPYTITLERAHELIAEKRLIEANRVIREFGGTDVRVLNGRFGPYVTDGKKNGKIPKDRDPKSLTLEECQALLAAAPARASRWGKKAAPAKAPAEGEAAATATGEVSAPVRKRAATKKSTPAKKSAARRKVATTRKGAARTQG